MIVRYIMDELVAMVMEVFLFSINILMIFFEISNSSTAIQNIYLVFGMFSGAIFVVAVIFAFFRLQMNKLQGRGSYASFMEGVLYGIFHTAFATALIPTSFLLLSRIGVVMTKSYLQGQVLEVKREMLEQLMRDNVWALIGGQEVFLIFFLFVIVLAYFMIKIFIMCMENFGIIVVQTCIFAILVYDTILNEGIGTMKFFKVSIGTILGQFLMIFFALVGMLLLFDGGNFIIGLSMIIIAPKLPKLLPNYLGSTGKIMETGKSFGLNTSMLTSAVRMGAGAIG